MSVSDGQSSTTVYICAMLPLQVYLHIVIQCSCILAHVFCVDVSLQTPEFFCSTASSGLVQLFTVFTVSKCA